MSPDADKRIAVIAATAAILDQLTKLLVLINLPYGQEKVLIEGFFKFVHWGNTGAATCVSINAVSP